MQAQCKINIDRLLDDQVLTIKESLPLDFIDITETDLKFSPFVSLEGKAYLAGDHLIVQLCIETEVVMPCAICNESSKVKIVLKDFYHTKERAEIRNSAYNLIPKLREAILLEIPAFTECENNDCPNRLEINKYLVKEPAVHDTMQSIQFPFANLNKQI